MSRTNRNRGFSLVEVLVGVVILGLVVSPLLHTMVTAMNTARKSRTAQELNLLAGNLAETVNAVGLDTLISSTPQLSLSSFGATGFSAAFSDENGDPLTVEALPAVSERGDRYYIALRSVRLGNETADALITLDSRSRWEGGYNPNDEEIVRYSAMDGVYTQPSGGWDPDAEAAEFLLDQAIAIETALHSAAEEAGTAHTMREESVIRSNIADDRDVSIYIEKLPQAGNESQGTVLVTARFDYTAAYEDSDGESHNLNAYGYDIDVWQTPYDESLADCYDFSVFFFYFPDYSPGDEHIDVYNNDGIPCRLFLVRQARLDVNGNPTADCSAGEGTYSARLTLHEPWEASGETASILSIYSNLQQSVAVPGSPTSVGSYYIQKGAWRVKQPSLPTGLVDQSPLNRLYAVRVALYEPGSDFASDSLLAQYDASVVQ